MSDDALDRVLDRLEELDAGEDTEALRAEVARGLDAFPDAPDLRACAASLAVDDGRFEEALAILDGLVAEDPANDWALRERAGALIELGRFAEALAALRGLPPDARRRLDGGERAAFHTDLALCL